MATTALSAQEEAIRGEKKVIHGTVTDRVLRMYDAIRAYGPPRVTLVRAVLFTESFKGTENQPLVLRWAKALKHFVEKVPVMIFPDELIVGRPNTWFGKWGIVYPELDGSVMPAGVEMFKKNKGKPGDVSVTEEDDKIISEVLTPYWAGRDFSTNFIKSWTIAKPLLSFIVVPLVIGMAVRRGAEPFAETAHPIVKKVTGIDTLALAILAFSLNWRDLLGAFGTYVIGTQVLYYAALATASYGLGFGLSHGQKSVVALGVGTRNIGAALAPLFAIANTDQRAITMCVLATFITPIVGFGTAAILAHLAPAGQPASGSAREAT